MCLPCFRLKHSNKNEEEELTAASFAGKNIFSPRRRRRQKKYVKRPPSNNKQYYNRLDVLGGEEKKESGSPRVGGDIGGFGATEGYAARQRNIEEKIRNPTSRFNTILPGSRLLGPGGVELQDGTVIRGGDIREGGFLKRDVRTRDGELLPKGTIIPEPRRRGTDQLRKLLPEKFQLEQGVGGGVRYGHWGRSDWKEKTGIAYGGGEEDPYFRDSFGLTLPVQEDGGPLQEEEGEEIQALYGSSLPASSFFPYTVAGSALLEKKQAENDI